MLDVLAYAITVHRSQGSEYPAVVVPLTMSAYTLLQRNLLYTAITRAKRLVVLAGSRKALAIAVRTAGTGRRHCDPSARPRTQPSRWRSRGCMGRRCRSLRLRGLG
jgi:exodeoxyribonuclease V alpha subunit